MRYLGIDLGTTSIKGGVLDLAPSDSSRTLTAMTRRPFPDAMPGLPPLRHEVDPARVVSATRDVLNELAAAAPDAAGILVCSQMHGQVLLNDAGVPITPMLTWQDQRALEPRPAGAGRTWDAMLERITPEHRRAIGNDLFPMRPAGALYWHAERGSLPPGALLCSIPDYVIAALCGSPPATDRGHAAATALYDVSTGAWHAGLMSALGLSALRVPPVARHDQIIGEIPLGTRALPVYAPVADQQCSLLGAGLRPAELSINVSTGSQVALLADTASYGDFVTRPFFDGKWLLTFIHIPAGRSLNALMRIFGELAAAEGLSLRQPWQTVEQLAAQVSSTAGMDADLSFFYSATGERGHLSNLREDNLSVGHIFRAAFESMARNYRSCAVRLAPDERWERVAFSGGLILQSAVLRDLVSAQFARPTRIVEGGDDALLGLLKIGRAITAGGPVSG